MNVTKRICVESLQVGENWSWVAPSVASLGTIKDSEKAPVPSMPAVPSFLSQPLTLIEEHLGQPVAEAVTTVPGGPCAGDSTGCDGEVCGGGAGCDGEVCVGEGWSETDRTAATGWFGALGLFATVAARAVAAAATAIAALAAMTALAALMCRSFMRRRKGIWCTVVPCTAGGGPDGHSAASKSAASARCDRPRSCQSRPYPRDAAALSSVTKVDASVGLLWGSLAIPAATSGRTGSGTVSSGTGSV